MNFSLGVPSSMIFEFLEKIPFKNTFLGMCTKIDFHFRSQWHHCCCILYILSTSDVHNIHSKSLSRFTWSNTISKSRQKKQQKLSSEVAHQPQDICWFSLIHCSFCFFRALLTYTVNYLFFFFTFLYFKYLLIYEKWCTNCKLQIDFQYLRLFFIHKSNCDTSYGVL